MQLPPLPAIFLTEHLFRRLTCACNGSRNRTTGRTYPAAPRLRSARASSNTHTSLDAAGHWIRTAQISRR